MIYGRRARRSQESAEAAVAFTVKTYGRMDTLINGAAGNFLANAHELKLKVDAQTQGVLNKMVDE